MKKNIILAIFVLFLFSCSQGPIRKIQQKRYAGSFKKNFSKKNIGLSEMTAYGDSLYWGSEKGDVFRINAKKMKKVWRRNLKNAITTSVFVHENQLYVGTQKGSVFCLDLSKGKIVWERNYNTSIRGNFSMFQDRLFFATLDGQIIGANAQTGEVDFTHRFFVNESFTLAYELLPVVNDNMLVLLLPNLEIVALSQNLEVAWKNNYFRELGTGVIHGFVSVDVLAGKDLLITPYMQSPFVLGMDGSMKNSFSKIKVTSSPLIEDGTIYYVGQDQITEIDARKLIVNHHHTYKNSYPVGGVAKKGSVLLIAGTDGSLDVFDVKKSEKLWTYCTESPLKGSPVLIEDTLWLLNQRSQLFAFRAPFQVDSGEGIKP